MGQNKNMSQDLDVEFDEIPMKAVEVEPIKEKQVRKSKKEVQNVDDVTVNCLRNERVKVRYIIKETGLIKDPRHILYGGMAENAVRWFTVPLLSNGQYVNVLTNSEKNFLEEVMGLEYNALSIYKKENNYWDNYTVRLTKQDNFLNLSVPEYYIKYKVLLANKDLIAASNQILEDRPKATYQFVIEREHEKIDLNKKKLNATMQAYMEFGKIQNDDYVLRTIIEIIEGRPTAKSSTNDALQEKISNIIKSNAKEFVRVATDPLLNTKVLIKKSIEAGLIKNIGGLHYLKSDMSPLCDGNQEPTLSVAAQYLNLPTHQELKFNLEAKTNK